MAKIIKLDKHIAELIAAGEVVERPASVVKELVENSIDAGASAITVEIKRGGIGLIRIKDNGQGIVKEDVPVSFLRHATSKVRNENDLNNIGTLGFRGEALASICAVSKVTLETRTADEAAGTSILVEGGEVKHIGECGHNIGTTVTIRDIFYNTPARMKFLKTDTAEANAVAACIDRLALSHVEISFKFIRDGKTVLYTPGDNLLRSAVYTVFGREFAKGLMPVDYLSDGVEVKGMVCKPEFSRSSRSMQYFFVNGRFVKTNTGQAALEEAYKNEIMQRKFPTCVLFIKLPNNMVDVNTHPAKIEVRFVDERSVYNVVYFGVKNVLGQFSSPPSIDLRGQVEKALQKNESLKNESVEQLRIDAKDFSAAVRGTDAQSLEHLTLRDILSGDKKRDKSNGQITLSQPTVSYSSGSQVHTKKTESSVLLDSTRKSEKDPAAKVLTTTEKAVLNPDREIHDERPKNIFLDLRFVGEVFDTYIIAEHNEAFLLIDKHAAHERLIFEKLKSERKEYSSQLLIEPVTVTLSKDEYSLVLENSLELAKMGIMVDDFGMGTVLVREFPVEMENAHIAAVVEEIGSNLKKGKRDISPVFLDELYHSIACKAAIKGNTKSSNEELRELIKMLWENGEIKHCPHGRPVAVILEKREIEKRFGRIV